MFTNVLYIKEMNTNEEDEQWDQEEITGLSGTRTTNHSTYILNKPSCLSVRLTFNCKFI